VEHRLVQGGESFLPFARCCVAKLKKLGLPYADQSYEVDGVSIKVRIQPGHEYIRIEGGPSSGYLGYPRDTAYDNGVLVNGNYDASFGIDSKQAARTGDIKAGRVSWIGSGKKPPVVSYEHGMSTRYRLVRETQSVIFAQPYIYIGGTQFSTLGKNVVGACIATFTVDGATIQRLVMVERPSTTQAVIWETDIPTGTTLSTWRLVGTFNVSTPAHNVSTAGATGALYDPWFFSPDGNSCASLITASNTISIWYMVRIVRGSITATESLGVYTLSVSFTVSDITGTVTSLPSPPATPTSVTPPSNGENIITLTKPSGSTTLSQKIWDYPAGITLYTQDGQITEWNMVLGVDYKADGSEVLLYKETKSGYMETSSDHYLYAVGAGEVVDPAGYDAYNLLPGPEVITGALAEVTKFRARKKQNFHSRIRMLAGTQMLFECDFTKALDNVYLPAYPFNVPSYVTAHQSTGIANTATGSSYSVVFSGGGGDATNVNIDRFVIHDVDIRINASVYERIREVAVRSTTNGTWVLGPGGVDGGYSPYTTTQSDIVLSIGGVEVKTVEVLPQGALHYSLNFPQWLNTLVTSDSAWQPDFVHLAGSTYKSAARVEGTGNIGVVASRKAGELAFSASNKNSEIKNLYTTFGAADPVVEKASVYLRSSAGVFSASGKFPPMTVAQNMSINPIRIF